MRSLCWMGFLCVFGLACQPSATGPPPSTPLSMGNIETAPVRQAFERLARDTFRMRRTLLLLDSRGHLLGQDVRTGFYHPDTGLRWLRIDQHGRFPSGLFPQTVRQRTPLTVTQFLWPDPLPFLQPRQRDAYRLQPLPDTTYGQRRIARLRVYTADTAQTASSATLQGMLYLDGQQLIGVELQESHTTLFSTERRYLSIWLNPNDRRLVREQLILEVDPIGWPPYRFCVETQYTYGAQATHAEILQASGFCPLPSADDHPGDRS
ncbi:MAG: hypothetical protein Q9M35_06020 [Rhodothermus sp.]|nr:hypothetical protein [Rhodothermus sp.]